MEDFSHGAAYEGMTLSPDGKTVAYIQTIKRDQQVMMRDLDTGKTTGIEIPYSGVPWIPDGTRMGWINSNRLLFSLYGGGFSAMDRDGKNYVGLTGRDRPATQNGRATMYNTSGVIHSFNDEKDGEVLMAEYDQPVGLGDNQWYAIRFPHVLKVNTRTAGVVRVLRNPGNVEYWLADSQGVIRVGLESRNGIARTIYRESETGPWLPLPGMDWSDPLIRPLAFSGDDRTLYVNKLTPERNWAVYPYDLQTKQLGEPVVAHELYDIIPNDWRSHANGVSLQGLIFSPRKGGELLGVRFQTDYPRVVWLNETFAGIQAAIDAALPNKVNTIISMSHDHRRLIVLSWSSNDPGAYYLYDTEGPALSRLLERMPWVAPARMAETVSIKFKARDGLLLHGYLTFPKDRSQKNLPMVVMPHGGPRTRDVWGYDPDVQFLANRGYAVLQVNYRGSVGYGDDFMKKGRRKVGTETQNDITDATRWAIDRGFADPQRVAIMGGSFGGYSAMMGVAKETDLYRCAINIAGVSDWIELIKVKKDIFPVSYGPSVNIIGDPVKDAEELKAISPRYLAGNIKVPVLLIHGRDDPAVPYGQAKLMVAALEKAGCTFEFMSKYNEQHGLRNYQNRVEMYQRIDAFLRQYMPAE